MAPPLPDWLRPEHPRWRDPRWHRQRAITDLESLRRHLGDRVPGHWGCGGDEGTGPGVDIRLTPHWLSRWDWEDPEQCPLRRYTLPLASERRPDHPLARPDALAEGEAEVVPGLLHRYPHSALLLVSRRCPVYCGHCSRTRRVGGGREVRMPLADPEGAGRYLREHGEIHDVLVSGGDPVEVPPQGLFSLLHGVLEAARPRELRIATASLATLPQALLEPVFLEGLDTLTRAAAALDTRVSVQTQVNHPRVLAPETQEAAGALREHGVAVIRNQAVLLRGVNDRAQVQLDLHRRLWLEAGILPYYVFLCEMHPGMEHWRVPVERARRLEEALAGQLPGFATPRFMVDLPGLGKRPLAAGEELEPVPGLWCWTGTRPREPAGERLRVGYPDPIRDLGPEGRRFWSQNPGEIRAQLARLGVSSGLRPIGGA